MGIQGSFLWSTTVLLVLLATPAVQADSRLSYPSTDESLGEYLHADEQQHAVTIGDIVEQEIRERYGDDVIRRDAHPKAHGCPIAEFRVYDNIPKDLQAGVFLPGTVYDATVRFSNGSPDAEQSDAKGDTRGMAIKLSDVAGPKLMNIGSQANSQDFLLISHPVFFVNEASDYAEFFEISAAGQWWRWLKLPFVLGVRGLYNAYQMLNSRIENPLTARYWSVVPYQLGLGDTRQAVKYSVEPCETKKAQGSVDQGQSNFLRTAMANSLSGSGACMKFMMQRKPKGDFSVEDVVSRWPEDFSPFQTIAELHFPEQVFDSEEQLMRCEAMAFNPWHGLEDHRPLGAVNRIRKLVYDRIRRVRQSSY